MEQDRKTQNGRSQNWQVGKSDHGKGLKKQLEKAILIGIITRDDVEETVLEYLDELEFLALTAGAVTVERFVQKLNHPDRKTFVGRGKLEEIAEYIEENEEITYIFISQLTPLCAQHSQS